MGHPGSSFSTEVGVSTPGEIGKGRMDRTEGREGQDRRKDRQREGWKAERWR